MVGESGARALVILVLRECVWNVLVVLFDLPTFNDTGPPGYPPRMRVYCPSVLTLVTTSGFFAWNMKAELKKNTTFSSLLLFRVILSFLFSCPPAK